MEVKCKICQKPYKISKTHRDYSKRIANPQMVYICSACSNKVQGQAIKHSPGLKRKG